MAKNWRVARSLLQLRSEAKKLWPLRDTTSDGTLGDAQHSARDSKHNPGPDRVVEAMDLDEDVDGNDIENGRELWPLTQHILSLARAGHPALGPGAHVIYEGRIWSAQRGWVERAYTGPNAHRRHLHVAVSDGSGKDSTRTWKVASLKDKPPKPKPDRWLGLSNPPMVGADVRGTHDALIHVAAGNRQLLSEDYPLRRYGRQTADLIAVYQRNRGIVERGRGPKTLAALRRDVHG